MRLCLCEMGQCDSTMPLFLLPLLRICHHTNIYVVLLRQVLVCRHRSGRHQATVPCTGRDILLRLLQVRHAPQVEHGGARANAHWRTAFPVHTLPQVVLSQECARRAHAHAHGGTSFSLLPLLGGVRAQELARDAPEAPRGWAALCVPGVRAVVQRTLLAQPAPHVARACRTATLIFVKDFDTFSSCVGCYEFISRDLLHWHLVPCSGPWSWYWISGMMKDNEG